MLAWLLLCLVQPSPTPTASIIKLTGKETWLEVLQLLQRTGNSVTDTRQNPQPLSLKFNAGSYRFWELIDMVCQQGSLQAQLRDNTVELLEAEGPRRHWVAYDGPWRARLLRQSIIRFDNPALDRLVLQLEVVVEPRYVPLLLEQKRAEATGLVASTSSGTVSYDGEWTRTVEVRLPAPPRTLMQMEKLSIEARAWVAPGLLRFTTPLQKDAEATTKETQFRIQQLESITANRTLEMATVLIYPPGSLDWESHQARLLGSMRLVLVKGKERLTTSERDIRTDAGRNTSARWLFRQAPASLRDWQAELVAPAAPVQMPLRFVFAPVELP